MVQMNDLHVQYIKLKEDIHKRIEKVLSHGQYIMGPEVQELEKKLAEYIGVSYVVSCSNGTDALLMTLMAWGVGKDDAVFTTPFTFIATSEVIRLLGATPVFVDIDPVTYNINPMLLDTAIQQTILVGKLKPKAIISVDLFGLPADYDQINQIANKYDILLLEDAAQSFGSTYKGKRAGSFGNSAATSFFPAKPLGCYGDGGAIFTNDVLQYERLKSIRVHGQGFDKYDNIRIGINGRLDTLQAAILLSKLSIFDQELRLRNKIAIKYSLGLEKLLQVPRVQEEIQSSWAQYSVLARSFEERGYIIKALKDKGISSAIYYSKPLHLQKVNEQLAYKVGDFPVAENISSRIFSLPMHPYLEDYILDEIIYIINKCYECA